MEYNSEPEPETAQGEATHTRSHQAPALSPVRIVVQHVCVIIVGDIVIVDVIVIVVIVAQIEVDGKLSVVTNEDVSDLGLL